MASRHGFALTRRAREDLIEIWRYVADDNADAADRLLDRIADACEQLAERPELGPRRDDIRPGMRYHVVGHYLILYRLIDKTTEIVRVVHGRRDLFNL